MCTTWRSLKVAATRAIWSQTGQRRTLPAPRSRRCAPTGLSAPHRWHVCGASVISAPNISRSRPPSALPSSHVASLLISSSCGTKALGVDGRGVMAELDQELACALHEPRRTAYEDPWPAGRRGRASAEHLCVDPARGATPFGRRLARERLMHGQALTAREVRQLVAIEDLIDRARGQDQSCVDRARLRRTVAQHRHQRHEPRSARYQQQRAAIRGAPDEITADRTAQLELVARPQLVCEIRGHLTVVEALDRH